MWHGHAVVLLRLEQGGFPVSSPSTVGSHPWGSVWWKLLFFGVTCTQTVTYLFSHLLPTLLHDTNNTDIGHLWKY